MRSKSKRQKPFESVSHGQIIESVHWHHQITEIFLNNHNAKTILPAYGLHLEIFAKLKSGQILISTTHGILIGIAKDCETNFRLITVP